MGHATYCTLSEDHNTICDHYLCRGQALARVRSIGVDPQIRFADPSDLDAVLDVWRRAEAEPSVSDDRESLMRLLAHGQSPLLVAELDGNVVGTLIAAWDGWRGNLYRLAVVPEHRRRGIARDLVRRGEQEMAGRGAVRFAGIVVADHDGATSFWDAAGYERQSQRLRFVKNCGP
jgi:ribosomal protein S18 acetylase RimI-like enzyme